MINSLALEEMRIGFSPSQAGHHAIRFPVRAYKASPIREAQ
jgi:hypothetical protein